MLTIYGRKNAFNVQKVMWMVGEIGMEHTHIELGGSFGGLDDPDYRAKNPHGGVPLIEDGGTIIWESHTILRYLSARYGKFWDADPAQRTLYERWMDWSQCKLQPDFLNGVFWDYYRTPEAQRNMSVVEKKIEICARHFELLDGVLSNQEFLAGDVFSLADIPAGAILYRYFNLDIPRPHVPNVRRWFETLQARLAYRKHVMIPFDDLYGRQAF